MDLLPNFPEDLKPLVETAEWEVRHTPGYVEQKIEHVILAYARAIVKAVERGVYAPERGEELMAIGLDMQIRQARFPRVLLPYANKDMGAQVRDRIVAGEEWQNCLKTIQLLAETGRLEQARPLANDGARMALQKLHEQAGTWEKVAERCKLSLRTIKQIKAGGKVTQKSWEAIKSAVAQGNARH